MVVFTSLIFKREPSEVAETIRAGLRKMEEMRAFSTPRVKKAIAREGMPNLTQAIPVYNIGLKDLVENRGLDAAVHIGWRYLLKFDNEVIASADAYFDSESKPIFAQVNEGPLVQGIISGIQAANTEKDIERGEYEIRLLMIPALYVAALWLVDLIDENNIAIPIAPTLAYFSLNKPIRVDELVKVLQEAAKEALSSEPGSCG